MKRLAKSWQTISRQHWGDWAHMVFEIIMNQLVGIYTSKTGGNPMVNYQERMEKIMAQTRGE